MIVDNKAGAARAIGTAHLAQAAPDGYTLIFGSNGPSAIVPLTQKDVGYDPIRNFPLAGLHRAAHPLVHSSVPARTSGVRDQLLDVAGGHARVHHEGQRRDRDQRDRREVLDRVVADVLLGQRHGRARSVVSEDQRVTVRRAWATCAVPMAPAAPALLSTITGWPRIFDNGS